MPKPLGPGSSLEVLVTSVLCQVLSVGLVITDGDGPPIRLAERVYYGKGSFSRKRLAPDRVARTLYQPTNQTTNRYLELEN